MLWELRSRVKAFVVCRVKLDYCSAENDDGKEMFRFIENKQLDEMEFIDNEEKMGDAA